MLSTLFLILFLNECSHAPTPGLKPSTSEVRAVGTVVKGVLSFRPNENPQGDYFVVTKAYVLYFNYLQGTVQEQEIEIQKLRAIIEKK